MEFRISETFQSSLNKLSSQEQKVVKTTAFDLQIGLSGNSTKFHKISRSRDRNFWSVRANNNIRIIVHKTAASILLCYVDHHDDAYKWAERRKIENHPVTGAAQIVQVRELVEDENGTKYKDFYGMSSTKAQQTYYGDLAEHRAPEGKKVRLKYKGPIDDTVQAILGGIRSACSYVGAKTLKDLPKCTTFIRVTQTTNEVFTTFENS